MKTPIHIIVPVYRGIELTRRCLERLAESDLPADCRITLIDDASPEDGMAGMLAQFVSVRDNRDGAGPTWELQRNATNLGFVASVNHGMALHPDHDVVLLNSDTEVPPGWLQRLRSAAYRRVNIGTVTPFSNCGSLASYPVPSVENAMPENFTLEQLDHLFQVANAGQTVDIPTGVGFCLFIRRDCLDDTGGFDEATFGKGYGEENDFCLRASKRGWSHVLATDCFVFHKGRGSFGAEKDERVRHAYTVLVDRYPHYPAMIQRHFFDDPVRPFRLRTDVLRLAQDDRGIRLVIANTLPDSTPQAAPASLCDAPVLQLSVARAGHFQLRWVNAGEAFKLWFRLPDESNDLRELLLALPVKDVLGEHHPDARIAIAQLQDALQGRAFGKKTAPLPNLLDLVAQHATPRFTSWQALMASLQRMMTTHGLQIGNSRLLRPLAKLIPQNVRLRIRQWLKSGNA